MKAVVQFRGREQQYMNLGTDLLNKLAVDVADIGTWCGASWRGVVWCGGWVAWGWCGSGDRVLVVVVVVWCGDAPCARILVERQPCRWWIANRVSNSLTSAPPPSQWTRPTRTGYGPSF